MCGNGTDSTLSFWPQQDIRAAALNSIRSHRNHDTLIWKFVRLVDVLAQLCNWTTVWLKIQCAQISCLMDQTYVATDIGHVSALLTNANSRTVCEQVWHERHAHCRTVLGDDDYDSIVMFQEPGPAYHCHWNPGNRYSGGGTVQDCWIE